MAVVPTVVGTAEAATATRTVRHHPATARGQSGMGRPAAVDIPLARPAVEATPVADTARAVEATPVAAAIVAVEDTRAVVPAVVALADTPAEDAAAPAAVVTVEAGARAEIAGNSGE